MAQAKRKTATRTAAKKQTRASAQRSQQRTRAKKQQKQGPNTFFVVSMSFLAATLLVANLLFMNM